MLASDEIPLKMIESAGLPMRIADFGEGPPVLFLHGWPESWYSWRHQLTALVSAGFRVIAPDMPGYGSSGKLKKIGDYHILNLVKHVVGILDALNLRQAILVGHDWGAAIAWHTVQLYPQRFSHLINMSVPLRPRAPKAPMQIYKERFGDRFFYQLYFQKPGIAEAEFDADPRAILSRLYCSPDTFRFTPTIEDKDYNAGGWIGRLGQPKTLPAWLTQADLDYYVQEFSRAGFADGIHYYRNIDRNWALLGDKANTIIQQPVLFIAGDKDNVIGKTTREKLLEKMQVTVPNLTDVILLPDIGHWVQQEAADRVNAEMLKFLSAQ
jgi:pimeloyl-ACP methyl ester carboxylesterase